MARHLISTGLTLLGALAAAAQARCQWTVMRSSTDEYLDSQRSGELTSLFAAPGIAYMENSIATPIKTGLLSRSLNIAFDRTLIDQEACATFTEFVVPDTSGGGPYVIGTQLRFNETSSDGSDARVTVNKIDVVASTAADYSAFNATETMKYLDGEAWYPTDYTNVRVSRDDLRAVADAYLDLWTNPDAPVPWGAPCNRLEGGAYSDSCQVGGVAPRGPNTDRRYIIDDSSGSVNVFFTSEGLGNAPSSYSFRIEKGKLRYLHAMTIRKSRTPA